MNATGPLPPAETATEDASHPREGGAKPLGLWSDFVMAMRFFSRLPMGASPHAKPDLNRIAMVLPLASLVIGIGPVALLIGAAMLGLPPYFAAALAVGVAIVVGGAMAEDAIADSADGLFGGHTVARRREIMKDSRHGTYGVAALCLFIVLRIAALGHVAGTDAVAAGAIWLAASIVARSGALWLAVALPVARSDGISSAAGTLTGRSFAIGVALALVKFGVLAGVIAGIGGVASALVLLGLSIGGWQLLVQRLIGGQTGDLIGALVALLEIAALTALLVFV